MLSAVKRFFCAFFISLIIAVILASIAIIIFWSLTRIL